MAELVFLKIDSNPKIISIKEARKAGIFQSIGYCKFLNNVIKRSPTKSEETCSFHCQLNLKQNQKHYTINLKQELHVKD